MLSGKKRFYKGIMKRKRGCFIQPLHILFANAKIAFLFARKLFKFVGK